MDSVRFRIFFWLLRSLKKILVRYAENRRLQIKQLYPKYELAHLRMCFRARIKNSYFRRARRIVEFKRLESELLYNCAGYNCALYMLKLLDNDSWGYKYYFALEGLIHQDISACFTPRLLRLAECPHIKFSHFNVPALEETDKIRRNYRRTHTPIHSRVSQKKRKHTLA